MTADEIRALYVETLAHAELASVMFYAHDGVRSIAMRTNEDAAQAAVDALAAAGLLPAVEERRYIGKGDRRRTRYATEWKDPK